MNLIILAAGKGTRLEPLTKEKPKCMVEFKGKPLIMWQIEIAKLLGISNIIVVRGYQGEKMDFLSESNVELIDNPNYDSTNMVQTLFCARKFFEEDVIISYGDILYESKVMKKIIESKNSISVAVDHGWKEYWEARCDDIFDDAESLIINKEGKILDIGHKVNDINRIQGQYIGLTRFKGDGLKSLVEIYDREKEAHLHDAKIISKIRNINELYMTDIIQGLINDGHSVHEVPINRGWIEIDNIKDLELANKLVNIKNGSIIIE